MSNHPIDAILSKMSKRDLEIAEILYENGETDESMYAALPTPHADNLLKSRPMFPEKKEGIK